MWNGCGS
jgi:hypothetical protein